MSGQSFNLFKQSVFKFCLTIILSHHQLSVAYESLNYCMSSNLKLVASAFVSSIHFSPHRFSNFVSTRQMFLLDQVYTFWWSRKGYITSSYRKTSKLADDWFVNLVRYSFFTIKRKKYFSMELGVIYWCCISAIYFFVIAIERIIINLNREGKLFIFVWEVCGKAKL